jgi:helicase
MIDELDLPAEVKQILKAQGLEELYPPQAEAIGPALSGKNMVLALPTASGKSLVAYLAVLKNVLAGGRALYIVPLRALAAEKLEDLKAFEKLGIRIGVSTGDYDSPGEFLERYDVVVATSEKADSLLRHRAGWLEELSVIVADEVHLIGDPERGPTLEVIISRFRQLNPGAQLLALSATISNSRELAEWLGAEHHFSEWRPVLLKEGVLFDGEVRYTDNSKRVVGTADEPTFPLIEQVIREGGQCLMFVNTRKSAETMARKACTVIRKCMGNDDMDALGAVASELEEAEVEYTSMAGRLAEVVRNGVAFHHAGLTAAQRKSVEGGFRSGKLKLLVATPTLAAGINLPARTVIIRDIRRFEAGSGQVYIPVREIKQMAGRAGRPRYDKVGEAVIFARNSSDDRIIFDEYLMGASEPVESKLGNERSLRVHALSSVATGLAPTTQKLHSFFQSTFFAHQSIEGNVDELADSALDFLVGEGLVERNDDGLRATPYGKRVSELYIDPMSAKTMVDAMGRAGERPPNTLGYLHAAASTPDLRRVGMYMRKGDVQWLDNVAGLARDQFLLEVPDEPDEYEWFLADLKLACLLQDWIDEKSEEDISERYDIGPGDIRAKVESGRWILYSMREMARLQGYRCEVFVDQLHRRVEDGVKAELLELVGLRGVGRVRARALYNSGYHTLEALGLAGAEKIARVPKIGPVVAQMICKQLASLQFAHGGKHLEEEYTRGKLGGDSEAKSEKGAGHDMGEGESGKKSYFD